MIRTKWGSTALTRWDLLSDDEKAWREKTPFGHPCNGCKELLVTEADFAKHFFVPDPSTPGAGWCPAVEGLI